MGSILDAKKNDVYAQAVQDLKKLSTQIPPDLV